MYSSMLDSYEPPRTRPVYDNPQVVERPRSLLSVVFTALKRRKGVKRLVAEPAPMSLEGRRRRAERLECGASSRARPTV
jgi:hypothetical protein